MEGPVDSDESKWMMGAVAAAIAALAYAFYSAPEVFILVLTFTLIGVGVVALAVLMAYGQKPFFEYTAQLREQHPNGVLYVNGVSVQMSMQDLILMGFRIDDTARDIEEHGTYITFVVRNTNMVFWKDNKLTSPIKNTGNEGEEFSQL